MTAKKPRSVRRRWAVALAILTVLVALSAFVAWKALGVREQLGRGRDEMALAATALTEKPLLELDRKDFGRAIKHLQSAEAALRPARDELGWCEPVLNMVGGDAAAILPLIDTALEASIAGQQLYAGLEPLLGPFLVSSSSDSGSSSLGDRPDQDLKDWIAQLQTRQPQLRQAQAHLQLALTAYSRIDRNHISGEIAASVAKLDKYADYLRVLNEFAGTLDSAPDLLASLAGFDRPKTYLLLGQNNDELRPTGGFIGTFGVLVVKNGQIVASRYSSTSQPYLTPPTRSCPDPSPPWWIKLKEPAWGCWDAQWTADFPTLARQAKWFYEQGKNNYAPVDGVIAIDQIAFEQLLGALGPVQVPGDSAIVTADNFRSRVYLSPDATGPEPHKIFLAALFKTLLDRDLSKLDIARLRELLPVLYQAVEGKHLLFYFDDPGLQALAGQLGADGAIRTTPGDYLFVVNTSLYDKVYDSVREQVDYEARLSDRGGVDARTTLTWTYSSSVAAQDPAIVKATEERGQVPFLLNLTRIYIPGSSAWLSMEGNGNSTYFGTEADRFMAGTRVDMVAGESKHVAYQYTVPAVVEAADGQEVYRLLVQKQPGTRGADLSVRVVLPPGAQLISGVPEAKSVSTGESPVVEFQTQLTTDRTFEVAFRQQPVKAADR